MKDYEEMAKSVLSRRDNYVMERKKRMRKVVSIGSCFCLMLLVGVGIYQSNNLAPAGDALTNVTQGVVDMGVDKQQKKGGDTLMVNGNYIPITMVGKQYEEKGGEENEGSENQG